MIRTKTARKIAADWHGGQWSALYSFASTGVIVFERWEEYLLEIDACKPANKREEKSLEKLWYYIFNAKNKTQ